MIQLTRNLARKLRAVFRKLATRSAVDMTKVTLTAGPDGLRVRLRSVDIVAEYHQPGDLAAAEMVIPLQALADIEGRQDTTVVLEPGQNGGVQARWDDSGVPQLKAYETADATKLPVFPSLPAAMTTMPPGFLQAMAEASESAARDDSRYALNHIQLQGSKGALAASDGRQMLLQSGFPLPWSEEVLVSASSVFACKELGQDSVASIGKTDSNVAIKTGPWTLYLPIFKDGRFPKVEQVVPRATSATSHCRLDAEDQAFLAGSLSRLPGANDDNAPITLDLNGQVCVRAKATDQEQTVELVLNRSQATSPVSAVMNRNYLARALHLGLAELQVNGPEKPVLFRNDRCKFVVMTLSSAISVPASENAFRLYSSKEAQNPEPQPQRRTTAMTAANDNLTPHTDGANGQVAPAAVSSTRAAVKVPKTKSTGISALIEEAETLKEALRDILARSHSLVIALKHQRQQNRLMQTSLKALKELQTIE